MTTIQTLAAAAFAHAETPSQTNLARLVEAAGRAGPAEWARLLELLRQAERVARFHSPSLERQIREEMRGWAADL